MSSGDGPPPLSLRPFPVADQKPKNLAEFIARVNAQPGGFRSVTEDKLREDLKSSENSDGAADHDEDMSEAGAENDVAEKDPNVARMEVLKNIDIASNIALLTLDSMSLLLSKQNPTQAGLTLSQQLRDMVGIGTLGADRLNDSNSTPAKTKDQEAVAMGWTIMEINKTRDSAEEAAAFLEKEISAESKYWEDIISVRKAGWSVCKVPQERYTLGVRFGFSEAAPEFKNNGLAPMRRGDNGSTDLDFGRLGGVSEALVVTYERDGKVLGRSTTRSASEDGSLESRVLEARNTIFSQELWHELTKESRSLAAYDVRPEGKKLVCQADDTTKILFELVPLESCPSPDENLPENGLAEKTSMALHILLSYAHRYNELMRIRPVPPHISRTSRQQSYALLRPVLARTMYLKNIEESMQYVGSLVKTLQKVGLPSSVILRTTQASASDPNSRGPNQLSASQTLVRNLLQTQDFTLELTILPEISFIIRARAFSFPVTATYYYILLPPSSPLPTMCPPWAEGYPSVRTLGDYLRTVVVRVLTNHFVTLVTSGAILQDETTAAAAENASNEAAADKNNIDIHFAMEHEDNDELALSLSNTSPNGTSKTWKWSVGGPSETRSAKDIVKELAKEQELA
ncbi:subunit 17 of mediator complex domain-containing protein [Trichoderma breve]|uniref:Mediator of RNA polymerase II transcription subunit 17 n=1 Tax=Trichoderma breve TaxID=2034170 RepID=A0A9W9E4Q0_9HYPO|nr:subunit 17 of mediator complex domain-containing protein [Trichoderma breve]KAJ4857255.1 subunit 17 of mediator complex domain-containing protein [Trichoderma breve]